jgi:hypothetical protein
VFGEDAFDVEWSDAVAGHDDHVVVAGGEEEVAVLVAAARVAGVVPAAVRADPLGGLLGCVVVAGERHRGAVVPIDRDASQSAGGRDLIGGVEQHFDRPSGQWVAHRSGFERSADRGVAAVGDHHSELCLAVVVAHRDFERVLRPCDDVGIERLSRA